MKLRNINVFTGIQIDHEKLKEKHRIRMQRLGISPTMELLALAHCGPPAVKAMADKELNRTIARIFSENKIEVST